MSNDVNIFFPIKKQVSHSILVLYLFFNIFLTIYDIRIFLTEAQKL